MAHRIREGWDDSDMESFAGPVEADETQSGGKEQWAGRGAAGKTPVAGVKDRPSNKVNASAVKSVDAPALTGFGTLANRSGRGCVHGRSRAARRRSLRARAHVRRGVGEYVNGQAHTNESESFWSMLKRG